jgi:aspartate racemase
MGWSSTGLYYEHINRGIAQRLGGLHSALLALESADFAEIAAMELAGDWDGIAKVTIDAAKRLEAGGAEGLLIACNTVHKSYDAVAANVSISVLHIADATADRLVADGRSRVALLGSRFTMTEGFVRDRIERRGITIVPINPEWMEEVDRIIFDELAAGRVVRDSQRKLKTLSTELA